MFFGSSFTNYTKKKANYEYLKVFVSLSLCGGMGVKLFATGSHINELKTVMPLCYHCLADIQ